MATLICVSSSNNETISAETKSIIEFAQEYALSDYCRPDDSCRPDDTCRPD